MAEINFGILDTQAPGRIAALPQQLQEQQAQNAMRLMQFKNTVQQNALAQAKIDEYKRDLAEKDVLRKLMTRPGFDIYDPKYQAEAMGVAPTLAAPIIKHAVEVKQAQARTEKDIAQTGTATTETAVKRQTFLNQAKRDLAGNPSDDNIRAWAQDAVIQKVFSPEQAEQIQANLLKVPLDQRQAMFASAGAPARQPSSMERLIAARDALPVGSPDRLAIEAQINKDLAGNRVFDPNTGLLIDRVTGQSVASGAAPAGQPGAAPLAPGIAPVQTPQAQTGGFPRVTPQVQAARDTDRLAILERELASQQAAGRVDPALQAEIANARRQAGVPANALAGAAPSVNALAGAAPSNPAEAKIAYTQQQQALYEPVQVIDPASGNTVYVSKAEAIRRGMTPAEKSTDLTPKQIQQLELKFPQATNAVKTFESKAESLEKDLKRLAEHPGLSGISGGIFGISGRTPALTKAAREAEALYNSIIARGGFNELQSMRSASPTGGALGNVSNQENQYLRDAFAPIKLTQDTADLKKALLDAANSVAGSRQRIRETYDMTYEYRKNRGGATSAPASGGVDTNNPLLRGKD
jgi:hypothetical protein